MDTPAARDTALLLLRIVLGFVFIAHGWQKVVLQGMTETAGQFSAMHVPQPQLSAYLVMVCELIAGACLVVGFLTTVAAGILALMMAGAFYFVHLSNGIFVQHDGVEYVLVLCAATLMIVVFGAGRFSIDGVLSE